MFSDKKICARIICAMVIGSVLGCFLSGFKDFSSIKETSFVFMLFSNIIMAVVIWAGSFFRASAGVTLAACLIYCAKNSALSCAGISSGYLFYSVIAVALPNAALTAAYFFVAYYCLKFYALNPSFRRVGANNAAYLNAERMLCLPIASAVVFLATAAQYFIILSLDL